MNNSSSVTSGTSGTWIIGSCDFSNAESLFDAFLFVSIAIIALFENITLTVCYFRYRPLRSVTNLFLISLTASDVLVSTFSIPFTFGVYICKLLPPGHEEHINNILYLFCDMLPSILSIYSLTLVAMDRMVAVTSPYFYQRYATQRSALATVAALWVFVASLVTLVLFLDRRHFTLFIVFMSYIFPVTLMVVSYSIIGYVAKKHAKAITQWEKTGFRLKKDSHTFSYQGEQSHGILREKISVTNSELSVTLQDENGEDEIWDEDKPKHIWRELRASLKILLLLGVFVVAWTPFMALNIKHYGCHECYIDIRLLKYFKTLHYANSALNPVLFTMLNSRWRAAFIMAVCRPKLRAPGSTQRIVTSVDWA